MRASQRATSLVCANVMHADTTQYAVIFDIRNTTLGACMAGGLLFIVS